MISILYNGVSLMRFVQPAHKSLQYETTPTGRKVIKLFHIGLVCIRRGIMRYARLFTVINENC